MVLTNNMQIKIAYKPCAYSKFVYLVSWFVDDKMLFQSDKRWQDMSLDPALPIPGTLDIN